MNNLNRNILYIAKGGKLMENKWVYNQETEEGSYVLQDVTDQALRLLFEPCELEPGVSLKDIFLLLNTELELFDAVIGNWCKEIVTEGLTQSGKPYTGEYDPQGIEYLELYWNISYDSSEPSFYGYNRPDFHAVGFLLKEDLFFDWKDKEGNPVIEWPKGNRIPWSISFTKSTDLINIPVRLATEVIVYDNDLKSPNWHHVLHTYQGATFTLGNILQGIMWELSVHGSPKDRDRASSELSDIVKELKNEIGST